MADIAALVYILRLSLYSGLLLLNIFMGLALALASLHHLPP